RTHRGLRGRRVGAGRLRRERDRQAERVVRRGGHHRRVPGRQRDRELLDPHDERPRHAVQLHTGRVRAGWFGGLDRLAERVRQRAHAAAVDAAERRDERVRGVAAGTVAVAIPVTVLLFVAVDRAGAVILRAWARARARQVVPGERAIAGFDVLVGRGLRGRDHRVVPFGQHGRRHVGGAAGQRVRDLPDDRAFGSLGAGDAAWGGTGRLPQRNAARAGWAGRGAGHGGGVVRARGPGTVPAVEVR